MDDITKLLTLLRIDTLVLGSGGMTGFYMIGCLKYLHEINWLHRIKRYYGTSFGALLAFYVICGYSMDELLRVMTNFDILKIVHRNVDEIIQHRCFVSESAYLTLLQHSLTRKGLDPNTTFKEIYEKTGIEIIMNSYNASKHQEDILSKDTTPDLPIAHGVLMSSAIPYMMKPFMYNGDEYIDGALSRRMMVHNDTCRSLNIGIKIEFTPENNFLDPTLYFRIVHRGLDKDAPNTLLINNNEGSLSGVNFGITKEARQGMIDNGYKEFKECLQNILENMIRNNIDESKKQHKLDF